MSVKLFILTFLFLFFGVNPVFATISFTISNPQQTGNEVTINVSLSGLTSSCPNGSCYLQAAFTSPSPIRYFGSTKNNNGQWYEYTGSTTQSYIQSTFFAFQPVSGIWSGQLTLKINPEDSNYHGPGTYNIKTWRYSGNSNSASGDSGNIPVNIQGSTPTSTPTPTPSSAPANEPTPTSNSSLADSSSSSSSFTILNIPSQINSDQSFSASINLSLSNNPDTPFYLKGAFKKSDGSNYFGLTKVSGEWVKNSSTYISQYKITTNSSGNWSGNLEVQPDIDDSGFTGSGDYIFKVGRYKDSDNSSVTWSNESVINIIQTAQPNNQGESNQQPSKPSLTRTTKLTPPTTSPESVAAKTLSSPKITYQIASVAGVNSSNQSADSATQSAKVEEKNKKNKNAFVVVGLSLVFVGIGSLRYIYLKGK